MTDPVLFLHVYLCVCRMLYPKFLVHSEEWHRYENSQDADGYRSSSSENVRSDLDYSYSETSNQMDRRSCYECKSIP